jgi:hypothetical protein
VTLVRGKWPQSGAVAGVRQVFAEEELAVVAAEEEEEGEEVRVGAVCVQAVGGWPIWARSGGAGMTSP